MQIKLDLVNPASRVKFRSWFFRQVRQFMDDHGFYECDVPILQNEPNIDQAIVPIRAQVKQNKKNPEHYLFTSPEYQLKKILVHSFNDHSQDTGIYYLGHAFRDFENSSKHLCEFSILEWYALHKPFAYLVQNTLSLFQFINQQITTQIVSPHSIRLLPETLRSFTLAELWNEVYETQVNPTHDLFPQMWLEKAQSQTRTKRKTNLQNDPNFFDSLQSQSSSTTADQLALQKFFQCLAFDLDPYLTQFPWALINEYPEKLALLAAPVEKKPGYVQRLEMFLEGSEIANGALEYHDSNLVSQRLHQELDFFKHNFPQENPLPFPQNFIKTNQNLPDCCGIAIGIDRLLMYCSQVPQICDVYPKGIYDQTP